MKARDVIGRTIVEVHQVRVHDQHGGQIWDVEGFTLDNGKVVTFHTAELGDDYATEAIVR